MHEERRRYAISQRPGRRGGWGRWCLALGAALLGLGVMPQASRADTTSSVRAASAAEQSTVDVTPIPRGQGAILVPALSEGRLEPPVRVYADDTLVAEGRTGTRIVTPPGRYEVVVGVGAPAGRPRATVEVAAGQTAAVEAFFGAVRVQVVDASQTPRARTYVIQSIDRQTVYGPVTTAPSEDGPPPQTWLLPPGRYRLVLGSNPRATEGAVSFSLHARELLRYRLVADGNDLLRADLADDDVTVEKKDLRLRWVVGGSLAFDSRNTQLLQEGREFLIGSLFNQLEVGFDRGPNLLLFSLDANQTVAWLDSEFGADIPIRNLDSRAEAELLYVARLGRIFGPYARAKATTSYLEQHYIPGQDVLIDTFDEDGNLVDETEASAFDRVRLFEAGRPVVLQQGVGVSVTPVDGEVFDFGFRVGGSARQAFYDDGRFIDDQVGARLSLIRVDDRREFGAEATASVGLRIGRYVDLESEFDSFYPTDLFRGDIEGDRFPFRWQSRVNLGVSEYVSTTYGFLLARDEVVVDQLQYVHNVSLTLQARVF
ncbi:MAG: hypothetical protein AAF928_21455 [Myxococcota bacterium]